MTCEDAKRHERAAANARRAARNSDYRVSLERKADEYIAKMYRALAAHQQRLCGCYRRSTASGDRKP